MASVVVLVVVAAGEMALVVEMRSAEGERRQKMQEALRTKVCLGKRAHLVGTARGRAMGPRRRTGTKREAESQRGRRGWLNGCRTCVRVLGP